MTVAIFLYQYSTAESDGGEIMGVYNNYWEACRAMHLYMTEKRKDLEQYGYKWDDDYVNDEENRQSFGFYGSGFNSDQVWEGLVELWEVR